MRDIRSINGSQPVAAPVTREHARLQTSEPRGATPAEASVQQPADDRVEISHAAAGGTVDADGQRIADLRAQIAAGTYLTPGKIDAVVEQLLAELRRQP